MRRFADEVIMPCVFSWQSFFPHVKNIITFYIRQRLFKRKYYFLVTAWCSGIIPYTRVLYKTIPPAHPGEFEQLLRSACMFVAILGVIAIQRCGAAIQRWDNKQINVDLGLSMLTLVTMCQWIPVHKVWFQQERGLMSKRSANDMLSVAIQYNGR